MHGKVTKYPPPPGIVKAIGIALNPETSREQFEAALREVEPAKRGRPKKSVVERKAALAEYERRITTAWKWVPDKQSFVQPPPAPPAFRPRKVGRPKAVSGSRDDPKDDAEHGLAWMAAFWMSEERERTNRLRIDKSDVLKFIHTHAGDVAREFGITPDDLDEDRIYDLVVKSGRIKIMGRKEKTQK
jgi:hypothetical protein